MGKSSIARFAAVLLVFGSTAASFAFAPGGTPFPVPVVDESGQQHSISAEQFAKLDRVEVQGEDRDGQRHTWQGPLLADVLKSAGVSLDEELHGARLTLYLIVEAADGYRVVFALPEIDPTNADTSVILADRRDGQPLDANEGPLRIVAPREKRHARWVRQVTRLVIATASP